MPAPLCLLLRYLSDYVITSRALISSRRGRCMVNAARAARAAARCAASPPSRIQSLAEHERKPLQLAENKQQRPKSIASFCRSLVPAPCLTNHDARIPPFLFNTNERARKNLTCSQQTRKQFLINTFERFLGLLFPTFAPSLAYSALFRDSPIPTRHGRIAAL
jgi:hypothetical protein